MQRPYIGITGFMNMKQTHKMLDVFMRANPLTQWMLMVGVMMTYKTLQGVPTRWTEVMPNNEEIMNIFSSHPYCFGTLHYADYTETDFANSLKLALRFCPPEMRAVQLDMIWPQVGPILEMKSAEPHMKVVLQVGNAAFAQADETPTGVAEKLFAYGDAIDYVLLDRSMGRGAAMEAMAFVPFIEEITEKCPNLGIAVAGGLGPAHLHLVEPLVQRYPFLSIDAQTMLTPNCHPLELIDWELAELYLQRSVAMFR
jgi:hypothetical protein